MLGVDDPLRVGEVRGERLLAQHPQTGLERGDREIGVRLVGGGDHDGVETRVGGERHRVGRACAPELGDEPVDVGGVRVGDGRHARRRPARPACGRGTMPIPPTPMTPIRSDVLLHAASVAGAATLDRVQLVHDAEQFRIVERTG